MPRRRRRHQGLVSLPRDVAFQASPRLALAFSFGNAFRCVFGGPRAVAHPAYDDAAQRTVGPTVSAPVEPVPDRLAAGRLDRAGAAQHGERRLGSHAPGVVARRKAQLCRAQGAAPVDFEHGGRVLADDCLHEALELDGLQVGIYPGCRQGRQRQLQRIADRVARRGLPAPQRVHELFAAEFGVLG